MDQHGRGGWVPGSGQQEDSHIGLLAEWFPGCN